MNVKKARSKTTLPHEYSCKCGEILKVPEDLISEDEKGKEIALLCEECEYTIVIEFNEVIDYIPPRMSFRWTETFY